MISLKVLFDAWRNAPFSPCCNSVNDLATHYIEVDVTTKSGRVEKDWQPKPDDQVCVRERAWRTYARQRDNPRVDLYSPENPKPVVVDNREKEKRTVLLHEERIH